MMACDGWVSRSPVLRGVFMCQRGDPGPALDLNLGWFQGLAHATRPRAEAHLVYEIAWSCDAQILERARVADSDCAGSLLRSECRQTMQLTRAQPSTQVVLSVLLTFVSCFRGRIFLNESSRDKRGLYYCRERKASSVDAANTWWHLQ